MTHPSRTPFAARTEAPAQTQFDFGTPLLNAPVTDDYNVRVAAEEHAAIVRRLQSDQSIFRQDGKPFKTVEAAIRIQRQFDLSDTHRVAQITGGLVLTRLGHSNRPSVLRASAERQAKDPCFLRQEAAATDPLDLISDGTDSGQPSHVGVWHLNPPNTLSKHYTIARLRTAIALILCSPDFLRR